MKNEHIYIPELDQQFNNFDLRTIDIQKNYEIDKNGHINEEYEFRLMSRRKIVFTFLFGYHDGHFWVYGTTDMYMGGYINGHFKHRLKNWLNRKKI